MRPDKPTAGVRLKAGPAAAAAMLALAPAGCISVNAPEEPIVIELNINIRQEVIYRLAADASTTIDENADIF
ncbi:YnbE family lipoprotein [Pseudopontixanthobacter vadosimaris]|uniref:YnbE family lipoprotein n=1 Tax=Pseudopontixanthobacter vadosimaris TaxID=2726450 RepID=UPI001F10CC94|nr:YnbE family lipoprotein [Pseudopontixanthobacter vadosimaris]